MRARLQLRSQLPLNRRLESGARCQARERLAAGEGSGGWVHERRRAQRGQAAAVSPGDRGAAPLPLTFVGARHGCSASPLTITDVEGIVPRERRRLAAVPPGPCELRPLPSLAQHFLHPLEVRLLAQYDVPGR